MGRIRHDLGEIGIEAQKAGCIRASGAVSRLDLEGRTIERSRNRRCIISLGKLHKEQQTLRSKPGRFVVLFGPWDRPRLLARRQLIQHTLRNHECSLQSATVARFSRNLLRLCEPRPLEMYDCFDIAARLRKLGRDPVDGHA